MTAPTRPDPAGTATIGVAPTSRGPLGTGPSGSAAGSSFTGTAALLRLALRRDRVVLPVWIAVFVAAAAGSAGATLSLYPTVAARVVASEAVNGSPPLIAIYGRVLDPTSLGALGLWKIGGMGGTLVAVLTMLLVVRHSRAEEEAGRLELLAATVLGRGAALAAALLVGTGTALVLGVVVAVSLVAAGLPVAGSVAFGAAWASCGLAFAAVGAVSAQLSGGTRAANGLSTVVLVVAFLLRATGDSVGPAWLSWLSPIGWAQQLRPYAGERWWVLLLPLALTVAFTLLAVRLGARRDLDAGVLSDRAGPAVAAAGLRGPTALAWRMHRTVLAAWTAGFLILGVLCGSIATSVGGFLDTPQAREFIALLGGRQALTDAFFAVDVSFMGMFAAVFAVLATLRLQTEEQAHRVDAVLSGAVSRVRWTCGHLVIAALGTALLLVVGGGAAGLGYGAQTGDVVGEVLRLGGAALAQLPAALVAGAVVAALFGIAPRLATGGWAILAAFVMIGELGPLMRLRQWVTDLSPFTHAPRLPGAAMSATPLVWLMLVVLGLTVVGLTGVRRRDFA